MISDGAGGPVATAAVATDYVKNIIIGGGTKILSVSPLKTWKMYTIKKRITHTWSRQTQTRSSTVKIVCGTTFYTIKKCFNCKY